MNESELNRAAGLYGVQAGDLTPLRGGSFSKVYAFARAGQAYVLRLTPPNPEIGHGVLLSNLALMDHLAQGGVHVPAPLRSQRGELVETLELDGGWLACAFERAPGVLAEELPFAVWNGARFELLGQAVGRLHARARSYTPPAPGLDRPRWDAATNCFHPAETLTDPLLRQRREEAVQAVACLPWDADACGLIHTDLHGGNFMLEPERERITLLDFDDAAYGWYAMDIAMCLHDFCVLSPDEDKERFALGFLPAFLRGYLGEMALKPVWVERLPLFLKLLETGIFSQVAGLDVSADPEGWVARFRRGRAARIAAGRPVLEMDFAAAGRLGVKEAWR